MKRRSIVVSAAALITLGSGLVNLYSVIGPSLPERSAVLREVFPLEFLHLSRFVTLLIGFALVVSSINIYKRKQRAFQLVLLLSFFSVVFHFTKGLDYEESIFSLVLLVALLLARRNFTVKSSLPNLRLALLRLGMAVLAAFGYGVAGFWFLEPSHFGVDFDITDAIQRTFLYLSLIGDPQIVPHTRYALWFLDSLSLITGTAMAYAAVALFRPVVYRFRTLPHERARAAQLAERYGRSSLDFFKYASDKSFLFSPSQNCFLAYRVGAHFAVVLGDPVGPEEEIEPTVRGFMDFCQGNDWGFGFHQTLPDFLPIYTQLGFRKLKIGDDAIVDLKTFSLEGKARKHLRYYVNQQEKVGAQILHYQPPLSDEVLTQLQEVSDDWLEVPGRRERGFTLGQFDPEYVRSTPVYAVAGPDGRLLAFVNIIPSYVKGEATIDLMRRRNEAPPGVMDYLFVKLFCACRQLGFDRFNLGMAPMAGFQEREEATPEERAIHFFFQHLNFLFSYRGLRQYKAKFATSWEPRYVVYQSPLDLPRLAMALRAVAELEE